MAKKAKGGSRPKAKTGQDAAVPTCTRCECSMPAGPFIVLNIAMRAPVKQPAAWSLCPPCATKLLVLLAGPRAGLGDDGAPAA